jgi:3',5'-cyclic AMP phosphodiesterase CpdA
MPTVKLAFASDLHLPITSANAIASLAREVAEFGPDALFVAGDVAESLPDMTACLRLLRDRVAAPIFVLAGNHDLWARGCPSKTKWESRLAQTVAEAGCEWFEGRSWTREGIAVAGTIAWYDYSARDPHVTATLDDFAREKKYFNPDAYEIDWWWSDRAFAAMVAGPFLETLDALEADDSVRGIIVTTHVPLVECQMCRDSGNADWAFSNAYFGNLTLGEQVLKRRKVSHIISGHTHVGRRGQVVRPGMPPVDAVVISSEYDAPSWVQLTLTYDS